MTQRPFVAQLRAQPGIVRLSEDGSDTAWIVRVQVAEAWDAIRIEAEPATSVAALKEIALDVLMNAQGATDSFVVKLGGVEVQDERQSLKDAGVRNGSTLLVMERRKRAVR